MRLGLLIAYFLETTANSARENALVLGPLIGYAG